MAMVVVVVVCKAFGMKYGCNTAENGGPNLDPWIRVGPILDPWIKVGDPSLIHGSHP